MKASLQNATLVVLALLCFGCTAQQLVEDRDRYCKGVKLDKYTLAPQELRERRAAAETDFHTDYNRLFNFFIKPNSNTFIKLFNYQFGLLITLVLLVLLTLIFFIVTLCCRVRCRCNCWWECLWLFVIFFLIFLGLFITMIVFVAIGHQRVKRANCVIHSAPATLLYGNPGTASRQEFIGFKPLSNLLGNYTNEIQNMNRFNNNANQIVTANLPAHTNGLLNAQVTNWWNQSNNRIVTVNNGTAIPDSFLGALPSGPPQIGKEFADMDDLARGLHTSASELRFLGGNSFTNDSVIALNTMKREIDTSFDVYRDASETFTRKSMRIQNYLFGGFWTFFCMSILILIIAFIVIVAFCCARKGRCLGCIRGMKWCLILLAFLVLIYGIMVLVLMAGVAGLSPMCKFVSELNRGGWNAANTFEDLVNRSSNKTFNLNNTNPGSLLRTCTFKNSTGDIPTLFNATSYVSNNYDRLLSIVEGQVLYRNYLRTYGSLNRTNSSSIIDYKQNLANITAGDLYDTSRTVAANVELNKLVACAGKQYAYTDNACRNYFFAECSSSFNVPSCAADQAKANNLYNNIRSSVISQQAAAQNITNGLNAIDTRFAAVSFNLAAQEDNIKAINGGLSNTLGSISAYNNTLRQIVNCQTLQTELVQAERYMCFPFVKPFYVLMVLACIALFFLFVALWAFWALLASRDESVDTVVVRREEFLAVSEQELVPKY